MAQSELEDPTQFDPGSAMPADAAARLRFAEELVERQLRILVGAVSQLSRQVEQHVAEVESGDVKTRDILATAKAGPGLVASLMTQETRIHEQIAQRVGKAGAGALDLGGARSEIGRRLALLRKSRGD